MPIIVNGKAISEDMLQVIRTEIIESGLHLTVDGEPDEAVVTRLAVDKALIQEYANATVKKLPPGALRRKIKKIIAQFGGNAEYKKALAELNIDRDAFEADLELGLKVDAVLEEFSQSVHMPTKDELRTHYEENKECFDVPEMVVFNVITKMTTNVLEIDANRKEMEEVLRNLHNGADFLDQMDAHSDYPDNDGVFGPIPKGVMHSDLDDAIFAIEEGSISDIINTPNGFMIVQMLERIPGNSPEFENILGDVETDWMLVQENVLMDGLLEQLREKATIEYL